MTNISIPRQKTATSPGRGRRLLGIRIRHWRIALITAGVFALLAPLGNLANGAPQLFDYANILYKVVLSALFGAVIAAIFVYFEKRACQRLGIDAETAYDEDIFRSVQSRTVSIAGGRDEVMQRASDALVEYGALIDKCDAAAGRVDAVTMQNWQSYGERLTISATGNAPCVVTIRSAPRGLSESSRIAKFVSNHGRSWEHVQALATRLTTGLFPALPSRGDARTENAFGVGNAPSAFMEAGAWQRLLAIAAIYSILLVGRAIPAKEALATGAFALGLGIEFIAFLNFRLQARNKLRSESQETVETILNYLLPALTLPVFMMDPSKHWSDSRNIPAIVAIGIFSITTIVGLRQQSRGRAQRVLLQNRNEKAELERQLAEAKLVALSAQIEPHFLFNTLASIQYLIRNDAGKATEMTSDLIRYLRLALPRMKQSTARLADELELVRAYLGIMQIRMGARLRFDIDSPDALGDAQIPTMTLITLVENAIKHGLEQKPDGGIISVTVGKDSGNLRKLRLEVADTGGGFSTAASGTGIGLANIRERLNTLYGERASLILEVNQPSGVKAILTMPMERK